MADFTLSPGIVTNEIDNSIRQATVPQSSVAGVIGQFGWGPAMIPTLIADETDFVSEFGGPTNDNYIEWFNGKNFLEYGDNLNVVRMIDSATALNATYSQSPVLVNNDLFYIDKLIIEEGGLKDSLAASTPTDPTFGNSSTYGGWVARYPGQLGNSLRVEMCFAAEKTNTIGLRDAANTTNYVNELVFTAITGNQFKVAFNYHDGFTSTTYDFMGGVSSYFEDRTDILADGAINHQEKVITFTKNSVTYNMLVYAINGDGTVNAHVNIDDGTGTAVTAGTVSFPFDPLTTMTVRERSLFSEFSYDAKVNSPANLLGKVYYTNNSNKIYGVNTAFTKQIAVGDILDVGGQAVSVQSIQDETELTITTIMIGTVANTSPVAWARRWKYSANFSAAPATSNNIRSVNNDNTGHYNDQLHMVVVDVDGKITGTVGQVLETFAFLSLAKDGKDDFQVPTYYVGRVNTQSSWVRWTNHVINTTLYTSNWGSKSLGTVFETYNKNPRATDTSYAVGTFGGGSDSASIDDDDLTAAINLFNSKETTALDFFLTGWTNTNISYSVAISKMIQVAETRQDAVVCVSGEYNLIARGKTNNQDIVDAFISWRNTVIDSSYGIMDGNFKYQYDSYNDTYRWLPLSGDIAGLMARTDENFAPWYSPAGYTRGQIRNVVKLAYNPNQAERDDLYVNQINPVVTFRGEGTLLYGDKTMQRIPSAFDRINVRRLFITMKEYVVSQARRNLFEFNTPLTRAEFTRKISNYLTLVQTQQGLSDFRVVCNETNNTDELIQENKFVADIFVKPTYVINFIKLNFTAVGQTVDFADLGV